MSPLADRIAQVETRIQRACEAAGRDRSAVELLPVSKRQPLELIREAWNLGYRRFGENYVQEGAAKAEAFPEASFLLLGPLQRNKTRPALSRFQEILSVDRPALAQRLAAQAVELGLVRPLWIQVDLWDEATKEGGCPAAELAEVIGLLTACPALPLRGFMALPPPGFPEAFRQMAALREAWQDRLGQPLRLSMGMSDDLEAAIAAGSDQVRVGTAFFGAR
ncbi:MAG: hypothetical protein BWY56_00895 [Acidobacteria bacterium ADurb.Bin340]|jgi:hypothetical protein|nr:MAG: hypothetical protein BWY56_00895 [Acidobacteria bacterium ADurb.Bin340]HQL48691.1 YggS family pyridoxal phosphate-dependent enzyme [Holophaga sp.]